MNDPLLNYSAHSLTDRNYSRLWNLHYCSATAVVDVGLKCCCH